jgi:hypothetical protein
VQAETQTFLSGIKNTETTYSSGQVELEGTNNITVFSTTGQRFRISGANTHAQQTGISAISNSNTTYTSGTVGLSELGAITIRSTTGNQFQFSVNSQTVQTQNLVDVTLSGNTSGALALVSSGTLTLAGGNNITLSQAGNAVTISAAAAGGAQTAISGLANSQTTYTSGTVSLSELGAITIRSTTGNQFQFSVNSQTAQTGISGIANSQTTYTSGTVSLSDLANITIRSTTGNQYQFSVAAQSVQTQAITGDQVSVGVSTGGNTAGNTTVNTGNRLVFVGTNMVSLSQTTGAGSTTISFNATQSVQTQGVLSAGLSTGGNTQGNTTVNTGSRLVFVGTNNITLSQATAAGATTISISGGAGGGGGATFSGGMSTNGNTSGDTGFATDRLALIGNNNVTLSGSTNAGSMSISISVPNTSSQTRVVYPGYQPYDDFVQVVGQYSNGQLVFDPQPFPAVAFDRIVQIIQNTNSSNSSGSHTLNFWVGLYTRNGSSLSRYWSMSGSTALTHSGTAGSYSLYSGQRVLALTHAATTIDENKYWVAYVSSTSSGGTGGTYSNNMVSNMNSAVTGMFGSAANATAQPKLGQGVYSASSTALPASVAFSQIQGTGSAFKRFPVLGFGSGTV